jgi:hypothetical protein
MKISNILMGLLLSIMMLGCEDNDIDPTKMNVKEIIDPSCYKEEFEYDAGRLVSYRRIFGERIATVTKLTYEGAQLRLIQSNSSDNGQSHTIELIYGDNGLRKKEIGTYSQDGEIKGVSTIDFFYDEDQKLKSKRISFTNPNISPSETEFEWANGNIIRKNYFYFDNRGKHYTSSEELQFDDKVNYTNSDLAFIYLRSSEEATLSKNNTISGGHSFIYNKNGYPTEYKYLLDNKEYSVQMNYE